MSVEGMLLRKLHPTYFATERLLLQVDPLHVSLEDVCIGKGLVAHGAREKIDMGRLEVFNKITVFWEVFTALIAVKLSRGVVG